MSTIPKHIQQKIDIFLESLKKIRSALSGVGRMDDDEFIADKPAEISTVSCDNPINESQAKTSSNQGKFPYLCPFKDSESKWERINTNPDGDCGFTSLLYTLDSYPDKKTTPVTYPDSKIKEFRKEIWNYMKENKNKIFRSDDRQTIEQKLKNSYNRIIKKTEDSGWLSETPDLNVVANLKNIYIYLWNNHLQNWTYIYPNDFDAGLLPKRYPDANQNSIYLYNDGTPSETDGGIHFEILKPLTDKLWSYTNTEQERDDIVTAKITQEIESEEIESEEIESEDIESEDLEESVEKSSSEDSEEDLEDLDDFDEEDDDLLTILSNLKYTNKELIDKQLKQKEINYEIDKCFGLL